MEKGLEESALINVAIYFICVFTFLSCCLLIGGGLVFLLGLAGYILSILNASIVCALSNKAENINE